MKPLLENPELFQRDSELTGKAMHTLKFWRPKPTNSHKQETFLPHPVAVNVPKKQVINQ